jgi:hypothetical protein
MKVIAALIGPLLLSGCQTDADQLAEQRANEATCKSSIAHGNTESMADCVAGVKRDLEYIRTHPVPGPVDTAYVPAPVYNDPQYPAVAPLPSALPPPPVRCQSMAGGMGTLQTVCR